MPSVLAASAVIAIPGCSTDEAAKKDAEQAARDAEKAGGKAADAVDDSDSQQQPQLAKHLDKTACRRQAEAVPTGPAATLRACAACG